MDQERELVAAGDMTPAPEGEDFTGFLERMEAIARHRDRILRIVVALTLPTDWLDMDGQPYLTSMGAERLRQRFGLRLSSPKVTRELREDKAGQYYRYRYEATVSGPYCPEMPAVGLASARDKFFAWQDGNWVPASEINENHVEQKAMSNLLVNAVTRALGLRGLKWEIGSCALW